MPVKDNDELMHEGRPLVPEQKLDFSMFEKGQQDSVRSIHGTGGEVTPLRDYMNPIPDFGHAWNNDLIDANAWLNDRAVTADIMIDFAALNMQMAENVAHYIAVW